MIISLKDHDKINFSMFGKICELIVFSTGDNKFDKNGNYKEDGFELNKEELDCLNWFITNIKIEDYKNEIVCFCNENYDEYSEEEKHIGVEDVPSEIQIKAIAVNISKVWKSEDGSIIYPEISFYGDCKSDIENGICIGFRDKKFLGIGSNDWTL